MLGRGKTSTVRAVGVWTRPAVDATHAVYFGTRLGNVHGFDAPARRLFDLHLGVETIDSYPTLTRDGLLVIGSESGTLTAIGPSRNLRARRRSRRRPRSRRRAGRR